MKDKKKNLKVVSSENIHGSKIVSTVAFWPLTVAVGIILIFFIRRHLVLNLFPLPLSQY
jgi:hypothetical protein